MDKKILIIGAGDLGSAISKCLKDSVVTVSLNVSDDLRIQQVSPNVADGWTMKEATHHNYSRKSRQNAKNFKINRMRKKRGC